jgi:type II secretory pathway pseudopilin PulG
MSARRIGTFAIVGISLGLAIAGGWSFAQRQQDITLPEKLLPAESVLLFSTAGALAHEEAYKKTAQYAAFHESGLMDAFRKVLVPLMDASPEFREVATSLNHLWDHGLSLAIAVGPPEQGPPMPWGVLVVHQASDGGVEQVLELIRRISGVNLHFQEQRVRGRRVQQTLIPQTPIEVGIWAEGGHLMIAFGIDAINSAIAVAEEERENVTSSPMWEWYAPGHQSFDANTVGWFNFAPLRETFGGMPVPLPGADPAQPVRINDLLEAVGLDRFNHVAAVSGYQGTSHWSEIIVDAPPKGAPARAITWDQLPPIPTGNNGIVVSSIDWAGSYDNILGIVRNVGGLVDPGLPDTIDGVLALVQQEVGIDPRDLLGALGHVTCVYSDSYQGMFGMGTATLISLKDREQAERLLGELLDWGRRQENEHVRIQNIVKQGRTLHVLEFPEAPFLSLTVCLDADWVILGLMPQAVEATLLRLDGRLPVWQPDEQVRQALEELPREFTSLTIVDPRGTYRFLLSLGPTLITLAQFGMRESGQFPPDFEFPVSIADFPPTELVVAPLYPNVSISTADEQGMRFYSRQSLPGIPLPGGGGEGAVTVATIGVLTALLLPAVQQAREAARRSQSRNNLKQIGLALHNYHDTQGHFPEGTVPNDDLEPDERLSWLVSILPFIDQAPLHNVIDQESGWKAEGHARAINTAIPQYWHPSETVTHDADGRPVTHYAGVAGVGERGPFLPVNDPKAGMFGYNRVTRFRDVLDGLSNTLMVGEVREDLGPWAAGGPGTIRPLTDKPYINGPNGFGSRSVGGAQFLLGDGSVRFISENTDPSVMEALTTIRGGERIDPF